MMPKPKRRKRYRCRAWRMSLGCRNHGSCEVCRGNRQYQVTRARQAADSALRQFAAGEP